MWMPSTEQVKRLKETYKPGMILELTETMDDPYRPLPAGLKGECRGVDDAGSVMMHWSNGSSLSLIPGVDSFRIVKEAAK